MKKIVFIIPWFGPLPEWMAFTLKSMEFNPTIDFLFYTDQEYQAGLPDNVSFVTMSFEKYCALVAVKLGIEFSPDSAYKLCDVKPAFGYVHAEDIQEYDFWGFCDIDLIFGDIRFFLSEERLEQYKLLTSYDRRIAGHFTVMANEADWRSKFKASPHWQVQLSDKKNWAFDEKAFSNLFFRFKNYPKPLSKVLRRVFVVNSKYAYTEHTYNTPYGRYPSKDDDMNFPKEWIWKNGRLCDEDGFPYLYLHFLKWKQNEWKRHYGDLVHVSDISDAWKITSQGFIDV